MKKMFVFTILLSTVVFPGCQSVTDAMHKAEERRAEREAKQSERRSVGYWMSHNGSESMVAKAQGATVEDAGMRPALAEAVNAYLASRKSLQALCLVQDGIAVSDRALADYSEQIQKDLAQFTPEDRRAAYAVVIKRAKAPGASEECKKEAVNLEVYRKFGGQLTEARLAQAQERNRAISAALVRSSARMKQLDAELKQDKKEVKREKKAGASKASLKAAKNEVEADKARLAIAHRDNMVVYHWLSLALEASNIETQILNNVKAASTHLKEIAN